MKVARVFPVETRVQRFEKPGTELFRSLFFLLTLAGITLSWWVWVRQ